jgi:putative hemolysin
MSPPTNGPFSITDSVTAWNKAQPVWKRVLTTPAVALAPIVERAAGLAGINQVHADAARTLAAANLPADAHPADASKVFVDGVLDSLGISFRLPPEDLARIPKRGPLIVVANHPFGGVEGIIMAALLQSVRPDAKVLANYLLGRIPEMRDLFVLVDPFGEKGDARKAAAKANTSSMRDALRHIRNGGVLGMFPAGTVAHLDPRTGQIRDPEWANALASIIRVTKAPVLPIYFPGANPWWFHAAGLIHPRLRTALLPRALLAQRGQILDIAVGSPIPAKKLADMPNDRDMVTYLRRRTYMLQFRHEASSNPKAPSPLINGGADVIAPIPATTMAAELRQLPGSSLLVCEHGVEVYAARAPQIPSILKEIGRLRELTFRATGEGTGNEIDLDTFDADYLHLFVWHSEKQEIIGAYRLGQADLICQNKGVAGLYTSTLFDYPQHLLNDFGPGLELGRSFVRREYQKGFMPLLMLWRGIGHYLVANPHYRALFGPVSISNDYQSVSQQLMVQFLTINHLDRNASKLVKPRAPFREQRVDGLSAKDLAALLTDHDEVSDWVADVEPDTKGIPVLMRQYLKLGARVLAVNVDKSFGSCVDALIVIDLLKGDSRLMERYMGKDGAKSWKQYHKLTATA